MQAASSAVLRLLKKLTTLSFFKRIEKISLTSVNFKLLKTGIQVVLVRSVWLSTLKAAGTLN